MAHKAFVVNGNGAQAPNPAITIGLSLDVATRTVTMNVSVQDEMLLLYMLDKARDALKEHFAKQRDGQRIIPASSMAFIRN